MVPRRWRGRWRALAPLALALAALAALRAPLPLPAERRAALLPAAPHALAAHLADFNNLSKLYPYIDSWRVEEQWSNYTSWRYSLRFSCGARCAGRGEVRAHDEYARAPTHGRAGAAAHRVALRLDACHTLPLLPWPAFCEKLEVEWGVSGGAAGARVWQEARASRGALAAALGALRGADHLRALQDAFPDASPRFTV